MRRWTVPIAVAAVAAIAAAVLLAPQLGSSAVGEDRDRDRVVVRDADGQRLATVDVWVAETAAERYRGLSGTDPLADGEGMLFVHDTTDRHVYVMRGMNYPIDIVFVAADGRVTRIHHARLPSGEVAAGDRTRYPGRGRFVLEVPYGYTNRTGIDVGDRVVVPERYRPNASSASTSPQSFSFRGRFHT